MKTMRAAVLTNPGTLSLQKQPVAELAPGTVRVRLRGCGVCGSNLPVWEGRPWFRYPLSPGAPGHEGWGVVEAVADRVDEVRPGDPVALLSYHAFAECDVTSSRHLVPLPPALADQCFPGEALGCAMNIFRRSDIRPGQWVAIVGIGFLGALLTQLAARAGARVIAISRREFALETARRMGAQHTLTLETASVVGTVRELTRDEYCPRVIEATGQQEPLDLAGELTQVGGRLIIAGYHQDGRRQINLQLWNWRGLDVVNAHERRPEIYVEGMRAAVQAILEERLDPTPLYTHHYPLEQLGHALEDMRARPADFMKALLTYD